MPVEGRAVLGRDLRATLTLRHVFKRTDDSAIINLTDGARTNEEGKGSLLKKSRWMTT
jgi:hypothetical protein